MNVASFNLRPSSGIRWIIHLCFWLFVLLVYTVFFARAGQNFNYVFLFVCMLLPVTILATYFINYYLVPVYLLSDRLFLFVLYLIYTLIAVVFMESAITLANYFLIVKLNIYEISPAAIDIRYTLAAFLIIIFLGVSIKLLSHWKTAQQQYTILLKAKMEAELRFLKTQLNPHFLFNTLNNLYYLTTEKSEQAPKAILALSQLLQYILDDTRALLVPIDHEIDLVRNYIELEQIRFGDRVSVHLTRVGESESKVAPMLLLTLVENAFKHGVGKSNGQHFITISVESQSQAITMRVENSFRESIEPIEEGIGLKNLRAQLELLYPARHQFDIHRSDNKFVASLQLKS